MADGSFAVWDSERNRKSREKEAPPPAFVMTFKEVSMAWQVREMPGCATA